MRFWSAGRFLKTTAFMSLPMPLLAVISPQRALNRMYRRGAWSIARRVRKAVFTPPQRSGRGINEVMTPAAIAGLRAWVGKLQKFFPADAAAIEHDLDTDAPIERAEADAKAALDDVHRLQDEVDKR